MGYHVRKIEKGVYGEPSKIREELEEFEDSLDQHNDVMAILELSDLVGAVEGFLLEKHPTVTIEMLVTMARATRRAFDDGTRVDENERETAVFAPGSVVFQALDGARGRLPIITKTREAVIPPNDPRIGRIIVTYEYLCEDSDSLRKIDLTPDSAAALDQLQYDTLSGRLLRSIFDPVTGDLKSEFGVMVYAGNEVTELTWKIRFAIAQYYDNLSLPLSPVDGMQGIPGKHLTEMMSKYEDFLNAKS